MRSRSRKGAVGDAGATPAGRKACVREQESGTAPLLDLPISDNAKISETTIYPTIDAMWTETIASLPWFAQYSSGTQRTIKFAFYAAVSEALRTIAFRMNAEQSDAVFSDFDRELRAYDLELQQAAAAAANTELH